MVDVKNYKDVDLYLLLGIEHTSTQQEIRKAYRKKALDCHPDKNPDNPKAAELFHELSKALEILSDEKARSIYDNYQQAKRAAELRNKQLDSKRFKLKSDLEAREKQAGGVQVDRSFGNVEALLKAEMERLRKEGSKLLEEEQRYLQEQLQKDRLAKLNHWDSTQHRIKIKWKCSKTDTTNGGYSEEILRKYLIKYGDIVVLLISSGKPGSALVEFKTKEAAEMAVSYEKGDLTNPLSLKWIGEPPKSSNPSQQTTSSTISANDYESLVLRQLRQAEERKRLIEKMQQEEDS